MSFHSIPQRYLELGDPYYCFCQKTARLLAEALELSESSWSVSFQSRVGRAKWLSPYTDETVEKLARNGTRTLDVILAARDTIDAQVRAFVTGRVVEFGIEIGEIGVKDVILPGDVRDPIVTKMDLAAQPVLAFTIASTRMDDEALSWFVDDAVAKKLLTVRGVGAVTRVGGVQREVHVALDPVKLQALGATAADVSRQLRQVQTESAGGRTDLGGSEQPVRTLATVQSAQELAGLTLALSDGRHIRLDQVATVSDTIAEPRAMALLNGKPVVGFEVARSKGASEVEVGEGVSKALAELQRQRPDLTIVEAFNFVEPVKEDFKEGL